VGFEKILLMQNASNLYRSEVISSYVYKVSFGDGSMGGYTAAGGMLPNYSYSTAIGLFNALICFVILIAVNQAAKKLTESSLW
jgi:ABC-type polysaccharide transport system permease subunit